VSVLDAVTLTQPRLEPGLSKQPAQTAFMHQRQSARSGRGHRGRPRCAERVNVPKCGRDPSSNDAFVLNRGRSSDSPSFTVFTGFLG
jgi:hypothetical protein